MTRDDVDVRTRLLPTAAVLAVVLVVFLAGIVAGSAGVIGVRVRTSVGDGMAGEQVATLWAGVHPATSPARRETFPSRVRGGTDDAG